MDKAEFPAEQVTRTVRIICISDTHNKLGSFHLPDGDVLVHAGDLTLTGTQAETEIQLDLLDRLPHRHKVLIAGNHDFFFDPKMGPMSSTTVRQLRDIETGVLVI